MLNNTPAFRYGFFALCVLLLFALVTLVTVGQDNDQTAEIVVYASPDSLVVAVTDSQEANLQSVQFLGVERNYYLDADFPVLRRVLAQPGDCFVYRVTKNLPLPYACPDINRVFFRDLLAQDRFWYNQATTAVSFVVAYEDNPPISCSTECTIEVSFSPIPTLLMDTIVINGFDNIGTVEPITIETVINQTSIRDWKQSGWTGKNIRVGVLDRHFGSMFAFEGPTGITVRVMIGENKADYHADNFTQGTNVLEVIHAIAPDAELYACRYEDLDKFTECVKWMVKRGVKVINHSVSVPVPQPDGLSPWTMVANDAVGRGVLWVDAAGNFAQSRYFENFSDSNYRNGRHEFLNVTNGDNEVLAFGPVANLSGTVMLTWKGLPGREANAIDLDLRVFDPQTDQDIVSRDLIQQSAQGGLPFEYVTFDMSRGFALQIIDRSGGSDRTPFTLMVDYSGISGASSGKSIMATGDSPKVLTVGSTRGSTIAPYSSRGPLEDGSNKPDLVAPGEIQLKDGTWFVGTGASSAVVSGFSALVWEANWNYSHTEIYDFITKQCTTDDTEIPDRDNTYGRGHMRDCQPAPTLTPVPTVTPIPTGVPVEPTNTPLPTPTFVPETPVAVVTFSSINLREGPGTNYGVLEYGYQNDEFAIIAQAYGDWYLVKNAEGEEFWVAASVMNVSDEQKARIPQADPNIIPSPPVPPTPIPTPTAPPPPTPVPGAPEIPGSVRETSPPLPPRENVTLTLVITVPKSPSPTPTPTWTPSRTPTPSPTWTPSRTPTITFTPTSLSSSPSPTRTPTRTSSPTPVPNVAGLGQCVVNPPQGWVSYTIQSGDTVGGLASRTGSSVEQIAQANCLSNPSQIIAGQQLYLPFVPPTLPPTLPPDSDGDGTPDATDSCLNEPGPASNNGCPEGPTSSPPGFSIGLVRQPGTAASGGCSADSWVSGPPDIQGQICISNATVNDCGYNVSGPGYYNLDFGGVGQSHSVTFNSNYGSFGGSSHMCGEG